MNTKPGIAKKKKTKQKWGEGGKIVKSCFQTYSVNYVFQFIPGDICD